MKKKKTTTQYAQALYEFIKGLKEEKLTQALSAFVNLLARDHKLKQSERIIAEYIKYAKKMEGTLPLEVVTARELSDKELIKIGDTFSEQAEVTPVIDASILGGFIASTDEVIFDGSLKTQLSRLKNKLA